MIVRGFTPLMTDAKRARPDDNATLDCKLTINLYLSTCDNVVNRNNACEDRPLGRTPVRVVSRGRNFAAIVIPN